MFEYHVPTIYHVKKSDLNDSNFYYRHAMYKCALKRISDDDTFRTENAVSWYPKIFAIVRSVRNCCMFSPGLEPGIFRVLGERDDHYTTRTRPRLPRSPSNLYEFGIKGSKTTKPNRTTIASGAGGEFLEVRITPTKIQHPFD